MIRNYLTIAIRNLLKHKGFSLINIFGLSIGIACCVLLSLFIRDEFSYEKQFTNHERIYRLYSSFIQENEQTMPYTSPPIALALAEEFPEVELATRVINPPEVEQHLIRYKENIFFEKTGFLVDSTFFDMFDYPFAEGDRLTALDGPSSVVLSSEVAHKIFGESSPLDELLVIKSGQSTDTFRVTGVLKPITIPSHLKADFYMCMNSRGWGDYINSVTTWAWQNFTSSYVQLQANTSPKNVEEKIPPLMEMHSGEELKAAGITKAIHTQPLDDIRLYSDFRNDFGLGEKGNIQYIYILGSIGLFILLLACINFMNLTTARAAQRAGEVGVRKSLGATRKNLIGQFLGESMALVIAAMFVSLVIVQLALPTFNNLTQKSLSLNGNSIPYLLAAIGGISLMTGLVAGSYPAFFLSAFKPARILKDKKLGGSSNILRRSLVVVQFVITITLISSIMVIQQQLNFIQSTSLGFSTEQKIMIPLRTNDAKVSYKALRDAYSNIAGIGMVSGTSTPPSIPMFRDYSVYPEGSSNEKAVLHRNATVDEHYFELLDIDLKAGRELVWESDSASFPNPKKRIIVNEASLREFNIPLEKAIGSHLYAEFDGEVADHEIVGVVEDFHQFSLHHKIAPLLFYIPASQNNYGYIVATVQGKDFATIRSQLESKWKELVPNTPFESQFLSDSVQKQYVADQRVSLIIAIFTFLAIAISCLGLYGLSVFIAERRVKEIGIRKVLGASVNGIVLMLSKDFVKLVIIAFVVAVPLGYYIMGKWLEGFAYKIELNALIFIVSGLAAIFIAWFTIGFESVKAAMSDPVKSLRSE